MDPLRHRFLDLKHTVSASQVRLDVLDHEWSETQTRFADLDMQGKVACRNHETLELSLSVSRREHLGECISALPLDILHCIFRDVLDALDPVRTHDPKSHSGLFTHYSLERCRAPFALAAVCRCWRTFAISTATLWSWISGPVWGEEWSQPVLDSIDLCLVRSRSAPLDIALVAGWVDNKSTTVLFDKAIQLVGQHFNRWRTADLQFSRELDDKKLLQCLRGPSPVLTRLSVFSFGSNLPPDRTYLPLAPNLNVLDINCANFRCSPKHVGLSSLTSLGIYHPCPATQLVELLNACAQTLKTLALECVEITVRVEGLPNYSPGLGEPHGVKMRSSARNFCHPGPANAHD